MFFYFLTSATCVGVLQLASPFYLGYVAIIRRRSSAVTDTWQPKCKRMSVLHQMSTAVILVLPVSLWYSSAQIVWDPLMAVRDSPLLERCWHEVGLFHAAVALTSMSWTHRNSRCIRLVWSRHPEPKLHSIWSMFLVFHLFFKFKITFKWHHENYTIFKIFMLLFNLFFKSKIIFNIIHVFCYFIYFSRLKLFHVLSMVEKYIYMC